MHKEPESKNNRLATKQGTWFLINLDKAVTNYFIPKIPLWLETYHLTWMTLIWSLLIIVIFYYGKNHYLLILSVPLVIVLHYLTDVLDGAVGRDRKTGLIKWGYFVDHFLDFVFFSAVIAGYAIFIGLSWLIFITYILLMGFMFMSALMSALRQEGVISFNKIGPTEFRLMFIILHIILVIINFSHFNLILTLFNIVLLIFITKCFYQLQKQLWREDMFLKHQND